MAGTPQKMLEHLLETRLDGRRVGGADTLSMGVGVAVGMGVAMGASLGVGEAQDSHLTIRRCDLSSSDFFLDDFLLTHIVFMPYPQLTTELLKQYPFVVPPESFGREAGIRPLWVPRLIRLIFMTRALWVFQF